MLTPTQLDQAARHLLAARRARQPGPRIPESYRPVSLEDALAIQQRVQRLLGMAIGGWKCSLPTPERAMSYAAIFAPTISHASPCRVAARAGIARIEPEIAFVVGRDLPQRAEPYSDAEVRASIAETRLVLELLGSRYVDPESVTFPEVLADQVSNHALFVGPVLSEGLSRSLEQFPVAIDAQAGALHRRDGRHPDGHPLPPLLWLANHLASLADVGGLKAGQIVTTGSYAGALEVPVATPLRAAFGTLGTIEFELRAD
ncbi:MAG TPA: 2-keto-4-pentenoate hydratase [Actinomycetota bacterium]|nr:2-keto-4-pentenoate hydratase [Actinomycetota bacterium]